MGEVKKEGVHMRLTYPEELIIRQKRKYASYWTHSSRRSRLWGLQKGVVRLAASLAGRYKESPREMLLQIVMICLNWLERGV